MPRAVSRCMNRRRLLGICSCSLSVIAGCTSLGSLAEIDNTASTATPSPSCTAGKERFDEYSIPEAAYGELDGFSLTTSDDPVQRGDALTVTLTNQTDEERVTNVKYFYDIHNRKDEGWRSIFWKNEGATVGVNDKGANHNPGEGFTWEMTMSQDGFAHQKEGTSLFVCSPIEPGTYRFVFLGVATYMDSDVETVLAAKFAITDS